MRCHGRLLLLAASTESGYGRQRRAAARRLAQRRCSQQAMRQMDSSQTVAKKLKKRHDTLGVRALTQGEMDVKVASCEGGAPLAGSLGVELRSGGERRARHRRRARRQPHQAPAARVAAAARAEQRHEGPGPWNHDPCRSPGAHGGGGRLSSSSSSKFSRELYAEPARRGPEEERAERGPQTPQSTVTEHSPQRSTEHRET